MRLVSFRYFAEWLVLLLAMFQAFPAGGASVEYPAFGNVDTEEGTIEVWFAAVTELYPPDTGKYQSIFPLFALAVPDEFNMSCAWYRHGNQLGLKVSMNCLRMRDGLVPMLTDTPRTWKPGELHHVAFTWKGRDMKVFADGKVISQLLQMARLSGRLGEARLRFGDERRECPVILRAIRVSSVARPAESLATARPEGDLATLLLDVFDREPADTRTMPRIISGVGPQYGQVRGKAVMVNMPVAGLLLSAKPVNPK